jgi:mRNA interferase RelE/StbE
MKVELSAQVYDFVRRLAPEPRRQLRDALRGLATEQGDLRPLEGELAGFYRLRAGRYRVIFWYRGRPGERLIRCEFAEERSIVYQLFAEMARHLQGM